MIVKGKVKNGKKRGTKLGFPTANISLHQQIPGGIYISKTKVGDFVYPSVSFVGEAKTFNETNFQIETYLLDQKLDLYNKCISVELITKIRENKKFDNAKDLIEAMKKDEKKAKEYFVSLSP